MSQFSSEVCVITWDYGGPGHPGHAAMKYTGVPGVSAPKNNGYISFWPESTANYFNALNKIASRRGHDYQDDQWNEMGASTEQKLNAGVFAPNHDQHSVDVPDQSGGSTTYWLQKASHKIHIPGKNVPNLVYGLDLVAIYEWWKIFSNSPDLKYKFASKKINCAGVILVGLVRGGAAQFADIPNASLYIDPNQVYQFATSVQQEIADLNLNASAVDIALNRSLVPNTYRDSKVTDVMDYHYWKGITNLEGAARTHIADIDTALKNYHAGKSGTPAKKVKRLGELLKAIRKHTMKYPLSRRSGPVIELGKQALSVTKSTIHSNSLTNVAWFDPTIVKALS